MCQQLTGDTRLCWYSLETSHPFSSPPPPPPSSTLLIFLLLLRPPLFLHSLVSFLHLRFSPLTSSSLIFAPTVFSAILSSALRCFDLLFLSSPPFFFYLLSLCSCSLLHRIKCHFNHHVKNIYDEKPANQLIRLCVCMCVLIIQPWLSGPWSLERSQVPLQLSGDGTHAHTHRQNAAVAFESSTMQRNKPQIRSV